MKQCAFLILFILAFNCLAEESEPELKLLEQKAVLNWPTQKEQLENGSLVDREEIETFLLFSGEKVDAQSIIQEWMDEKAIGVFPLNRQLIQINFPIKFSSLIPNTCRDLYCYQVYVPFEKIPSLFWRGLIGVEDKRFLEHQGVDYKSIARAMWTNLKHLKFEQGGSTITQQLVKNVYLTSEKKVTRKIKEAFLSIYIEKKYQKEKILEVYLNEVFWGGLQGVRVKGFYAASLFYFQKKPEDITPYEVSILISMLKGPNYFSPLNDQKLKRLIERANVVYDVLVQDKLIAPDPKNVWKEKQWKKWQDKLKSFEKNKTYLSLWKSMSDSESKISNYEKFVLTHKMDQVVNQLKDKKNLEKRDLSVKVVFSEINALPTDKTSFYSKFERSKQKAIFEEKHQIGSTIKPIVYRGILLNGKKLSDEVATGPIKLKLISGDWSPKEAHEIEKENVTVAEALLKSYNRPLVRLASEIGFDKIEKELTPYFSGLSLPLAEFPAQILGSVETSVADLHSIYSSFIRNECSAINGNQYPLAESVLGLLSDPNKTTVERTVDKVFSNLSFFGKTGTTNNGYDNWFVAFDGNYLTVVWVGYEGKRDTKNLGLYGSTTAFTVFQNFYRDRGKRFHRFGCEQVQ